MTIAYLGNMSGVPTCAGPGLLLFAHNVTKMVKKVDNFDIFDKYGVNMRKFSNKKLKMPLLKCLLDTEFSRSWMFTPL